LVTHIDQEHCRLPVAVAEFVSIASQQIVKSEIGNRKLAMATTASITERKTASERLEDLLSLLTVLLAAFASEKCASWDTSTGALLPTWRSRAPIARSVELINYLNSLVIRAHGRIYRAEAHGVAHS